MHFSAMGYFPYRSNSSILGQRKKNQRKENKKREALRRSSESECSEAETDNMTSSRSPNRNQLYANKNQNQQVRTTGNWDCQSAYELFYQRKSNGNESTNQKGLDNRKSEGSSGNCEDTKDNGRARKSKSRRRKKRIARRNSDGEGNSSSDGQQQCYEPLRDSMTVIRKRNFIESY